MQDFALYMNVNEDHHAISQLFRRIFLALSYMKGPKINDWVRMISAQTVLRVNGNAQANPPILPVDQRDDEDLWQWFVTAFRAAYTDTTQSEEALTKLLVLKMQNNDLDNYIAAFDTLRDAAGWEIDSQGTILLFRRGLHLALVQAVIQRTSP
jgi:hypothetical protein